MTIYWASWENTVPPFKYLMTVCAWDDSQWGRKCYDCMLCTMTGVSMPFLYPGTPPCHRGLKYRFFLYSWYILGVVDVKLCAGFFACLSFVLMTLQFSSTGTLVFEKLEMVMTSKRTLNDVAKLSPHYQTSSLESFHSVILRFAPKNVVFPYIGMLCRWEVWPCKSYLAGYFWHYKARNTFHCE